MRARASLSLSLYARDAPQTQTVLSVLGARDRDRLSCPRATESACRDCARARAAPAPLRSQGLGNVASGLTGGMGGCVLIGQSLINVGNGGTSRLSGIAMSAFLAAGIVGAAPLLGKVPIAALVGVMLVVCQARFFCHLESIFAGGARDGCPRRDNLTILCRVHSTRAPSRGARCACCARSRASTRSSSSL